MLKFKRIFIFYSTRIIFIIDAKLNQITTNQLAQLPNHTYVYIPWNLKNRFSHDENI